MAQIFAHEFILQFVPKRTWPSLELLSQGDELAARVLQQEVPALGEVAVWEQQHGGLTTTIKNLAKWLITRGTDVRASLPQHAPDDPDDSLALDDENAMDTGVFYGRKRVRVRPEYPLLTHDAAIDRSTLQTEEAAGIGCSKYYESYGRRGFTGGVMGCWCPHLVCLGFHLIRKGEGRNDVFSALYCYWEKAPKYVVYDFACALAPYCMAREPGFFEDTRHLIDGFHAKGHTRCSPACFLSTYKQHSGMLYDTNSSAAECGNGGMDKVRRPVSYMSQRHATVFIAAFLSMWNRERRAGDKRLQAPLDATIDVAVENLQIKMPRGPLTEAAELYLIQTNKL